LAPDDLTRLAGFYLHESSDIPQEFQARDGHLFVGRTRLFHDGDWTFRPAGEEGAIRAQVSEGGIVRITGPEGRPFFRQPSLPPEGLELGEYVGRYWSDELAVEYEVRIDEEGAYFFNRKTGRRNLRPRFRDGFSSGGSSVTFVRSPAGDLDGFTISSGRVWKVRFHRR
jgi:hypothetical protein